MSRFAIPATKSNLLRLGGDLEFLEAGRDLLEQKREFLSEALLTFGREAAALRSQVEAELASAYELLAEAYAALGAAGVRRLALSSEPVAVGEVRERSMMGVTVPLLEPTQAAEGASRGGLAAAPGEVGGAAHAAGARLRAIAGAVAELAGLESCCRRLARELARTRRKLNALEVVHIPSHRETLRFIADQLEERERESLFQLKRVKALRKDAS
jgi:V/A-type H+-transporting ATPase subunit D